MSMISSNAGVVNTMRPGLANNVFDGSNDYLDRGATLTGAADNEDFAFYIKFRSTLSSGFRMIMAGDHGRFDVFYEAGSFGMTVRNTSGTQICAFEGVGSGGLDDGSDHEVWVTFDGGAGTITVYLDGSSDSPTINAETAGTCDLTATDWAVGADSAGGDKFDGGITRITLWTPSDLTDFDISTSGGRDDMADTSKAPQLGSGAILDIYGGNSHVNAGINFGSGGHFNINGAVA